MCVYKWLAGLRVDDAGSLKPGVTTMEECVEACNPAAPVCMAATFISDATSVECRHYDLHNGLNDIDDLVQDPDAIHFQKLFCTGEKK